jgi:hypothetical protein
MGEAEPYSLFADQGLPQNENALSITSRPGFRPLLQLQ